MLSESRVDQVRRLLAEGRLSQRSISRLTGVSRGTISAIAAGKRPERPPRPVEPWLQEPLGPVGRCQECGARVQLPCRLCRMRVWINSLESARRSTAHRSGTQQSGAHHAGTAPSAQQRVA